ncbi:zinc finger transcription factor ace1 [Pochonia chlamydosporia 170]|uniref:Zinc finger transcription factor ace1 n=1 Tax=Pochonia chlamydosporia 170 TaxID=1380566 RepID=A0A179G5B6_METCM|nr:zinc finger transcription factor ace1 [Pochonia chlamydosporia 170]OAQ72543.1 zinc finger transcription factor ace1 [Pochonia chlamydosporia 170]
MSFANPRRRTPVTRSGRDNESGLALKTTMTLRKGATFHSPTSPVSSNSDDTFVPPQLSRARTHLDDVVDANRRRVALTLSDIDEALAKTESLSLSPKPKKNTLRDTSLPVPRGFLDLPVVDPTMANPEPERRVLRPRSVRRSKQQASDSGLGSSIASTNEKCEAGKTSQKKKKDTKTLSTGSALTGSGAASTKEMLPALSRKAFNRIHEHTLRPLLEKPTLKDFEPIVLDVPRKIRSKEIICLRDLEKTLIFMAPETAKTAALYLDFCLTSIRCIQATVEYLTDREQIRPGDRPYTNGYFIDLKEQVYQYGRQLAAAKEKGGSGDDMDVDIDDEIRLYGGIAENGRPAELIRVRKDGSAISIATGKPVDMGEGPITFKRSLSEQREDEEEIMRSMARRKKNATAEELAPKKCREPGCNKEFKRPCDLTKHEKTHSRPWKCPIPTCKYHEFGWPTEKEMDRHVNDKHSDAPAMYECMYKPCPYKSKRESNCKQHMEKAHGWQYVRTKTNGKKLPGKPASSVQQTPPLGSVSTPSSTPTYSVPTPPQDQDALAFASYHPDSDWFAAYSLQPETLDGMDLTLEHTSPSSATSYEQYPPYQNGSTFILNDEDIYAAHVQLPAQLHAPEQLYNKLMPQQMPVYQAPQPCTAPQLQVPPHFSPSGQENAMLFTPNSLREVDEGFDEAYNGDGSDFQLFPAASTNKGNNNNFQQPLFAEVPSANLGFSQASQPDFFNQVDWANLDLQPFRE